MTCLGVYGCGKMGGIILEGIVKNGICAEEDVVISEAHDVTLAAIKTKFQKATCCSSDTELLSKADHILLAVKPHIVGTVLERIKSQGKREAIVISIAAGVGLDYLREKLAATQHAVRVMPNTPLQVGAGMSVISAREDVPAEHVAFVERIFGALGGTMRLREELMDAATALVGSGPGLVLTLLEGLSDGGVLLGLTRDQALRMAAQTMLGTAKLLLETGAHPAVLRDQVTTPGGCTIAGCVALEDRAVRAALARAVQTTAETASKLNAPE